MARQEFDNVVVDLGSKLDLMGTAAYKEATTVYLVTQASIPELRNSNRLISQFFAGAAPKLEIVINRFEPRALGVSEEHITKGADQAGAVEDSQRLCVGAEDADQRHAAGACGFGDYAPDPADGEGGLRQERPARPSKKKFRLFRMKDAVSERIPQWMEG